MTMRKISEIDGVTAWECSECGVVMDFFQALAHLHSKEKKPKNYTPTLEKLRKPEPSERRAIRKMIDAAKNRFSF